MENTMEATPSVLAMQRTYMMLVVWAEPKQHTRQGELIGRQSYTCYRRAECSEATQVFITRAGHCEGPNTTEDSHPELRLASDLI
ncbi:unnamed protein product [Clonostachys rhizophaga]|uniref:Uncharacterized protein n=1 Tax=Clonostachys rhizophaga TaxID=160324 RepID=A0A9N9VHP5_9HYPO|nr:unnamed protein product [Clonostachys rhizophaga]